MIAEYFSRPTNGRGFMTKDGVRDKVLSAQIAVGGAFFCVGSEKGEADNPAIQLYETSGTTLGKCHRA
jgi:hypothetical protein